MSSKPKFTIRKGRNVDLFYVYDHRDCSRVSHDNMPRELAVKQQIALYAKEGVKYKPPVKQMKFMRYEKGSEEAHKACQKAREGAIAKRLERQQELQKKLQVLSQPSSNPEVLSSCDPIL